MVEPITSGATSDENMRPRETSSQTKETKAESSQSQRRNSPPKSLKEKANRKTSSPFLRKKYMTDSKDLEKNTKSHRVASKRPHEADRVGDCPYHRVFWDIRSKIALF